MKYIKKPLACHVTFADTPGQILTLEGPVNYDVGDAILTGVNGEKWPILRAAFQRSYEPIEGTNSAKEGFFIKKRIPVDAIQAKKPMAIALSGGSTLNAAVGDWIITDESGNQWVVNDQIFKLSYQELEEHNE